MESHSGLEWLGILLGVLLIGITLLDIFLTVLHVQAESPLSSRVHRLLWSVLSALTLPMPRRVRGSTLALGMPLMVVATMAFWTVLFVVGFGAIYASVLDDPAWFSARQGGGAPLADALYFSAVSYFTLGYGDIVPIHPLARLLAVVEGALGLLTISLAVTYLLSVYPLIARKVALAASLNQETAGRPDGVAVAERYVRPSRYEVLGDRLRRLNDELLYLGQAHSFYPVLFYVRPKEVHESFARVLVLVQGLVGTLRYGLDRRAHADVVDDPRLAILEEGLLYTLHSLEHSSHLARGAGEDHEEELLAGFRRMGEELERRGLSPARGSQAAADYMRFRLGTDPYIRAYACNVRYEPSSVWATYGRWARGTALEAAGTQAAA